MVLFKSVSLILENVSSMLNSSRRLNNALSLIPILVLEQPSSSSFLCLLKSQFVLW